LGVKLLNDNSEFKRVVVAVVLEHTDTFIAHQEISSLIDEITLI
jgi:hypothetical protein